MFALPISKPRFNSIIFFYQNSPKIALKLSYFCKKCKIFERWRLRPQTLKNSLPSLQISGYAPEFTYVLRKVNVSLQNRYRYWYFVGVYDLKQHVKTCFKRSAVFVFQSTLKIFLGRGQWRNHGERAKGVSVPFTQVF